MSCLRILIPTAAILSILASGCGDPRGPEQGTPPATGGDPATSPPSGSPDVNGALYAVGWDTVIINANYAKTTVDHVAHFLTTRNACGRDAYGAIELGVWNQFTESLNAAMLEAPLEEPRCRTVETYSKMDGTAEALLEGRKRLLFEVRGHSEVCTTIRDRATEEKLFSAITAIVLAADKEDCSLVN
ncbi:MAG: hypothetical protein NDJ89_01060 [Oligoflexia bacterium]|nr:hypothetical protein [Oligoflexia bacterium]